MDTQPIKQVCGVCHDEWLTEDEYNNHVCAVTGFTPQQPEHLVNSTTPEFLAIQQAALERGAVDVAAATDAPAEWPAPDAPSEPQAPAITLG